MDKTTFNKGMAILMASYPEYECKPETLQAYREFLKDFDPADFEKVIKNHISQSRFFPKICELKEELVRLKGFHRPTAAQAWEGLIKAVEADVKPLMDEATERAMRAACGDWQGLTLLTYKEMPFALKRFQETYNEAIAHDDRQVKLGGAAPLQIAERKQIEGNK